MPRKRSNNRPDDILVVLHIQERFSRKVVERAYKREQKSALADLNLLCADNSRSEAHKKKLRKQYTLLEQYSVEEFVATYFTDDNYTLFVEEGSDRENVHDFVDDMYSQLWDDMTRESRKRGKRKAKR